MTNYTSSGKMMMVLLTARMIKNMLWYKISQYFFKPKEHSNGNGNVEVVDLLKYAKKADLKRAIAGDTSNLAAKSDLASLKDEIDKIDID